MRVLHGGFEEWEARGLPTQPKGPERQIDSYPWEATAKDSPEPAPSSNPLDAVRNAGL